MPLPCVLDDYDVESFLREARAVREDRFEYVVTPNIDHIIRFHDDAKFRAHYADAAYVLLDSQFLSHIFRLTKGVKVRVCTGSDLTAQLFEKVIERDDRIVLIGGSAGQAKQLAERYGIKTIQHHNPPMGFVNDAKAVDECIRFIEANSPFRFCFFAVGAPQQEFLAQAIKARGVARGMGFCVGASVNFLTGSERRAPRWMQRAGMEWMYRLARNPRRLAKRYLVRGPRVFSLLPATRFSIRRPAVAMPRLATAVTGSIGTE